MPREILRMGKRIVKGFVKYTLNRRHLKLSSLHMLVQDIEMKAGIFPEKVLGGDHGKLYWIGQMNTNGSLVSCLWYQEESCAIIAGMGSSVRGRTAYRWIKEIQRIINTIQTGEGDGILQ